MKILRTASLGSNFTSSYKKNSVVFKCVLNGFHVVADVVFAVVVTLGFLFSLCLKRSWW